MKLLTGETKGRPGSDETRAPINIDADVRDRLRHLLYRPEMRGVGYSEFLDRAVAAAHAEIDAESSVGVASYRGVTAQAIIEDYSEGEEFVTVKLLVDPAPRGLDRERYIGHQKAAQ